MTTSIFEAMGGYESAPVEEDQPAKPKRRRVDEYTLKLSPQQWRVLEALADGGQLVKAYAKYVALYWHNDSSLYSHTTATSLEKRNLIKAKRNDTRTGGSVAYYSLTDEGRKALRIRRENKQGSGLI